MRKLAVLFIVVAAALSYAVASLFSPTLLFFPYQRTVGGTHVYAEAPIPDVMTSIIAVSNQTLAQSRISSLRRSGARSSSPTAG